MSVLSLSPEPSAHLKGVQLQLQWSLRGTVAEYLELEAFHEVPYLIILKIKIRTSFEKTVILVYMSIHLSFLLLPAKNVFWVSRSGPEMHFKYKNTCTVLLLHVVQEFCFRLSKPVQRVFSTKNAQDHT